MTTMHNPHNHQGQTLRRSVLLAAPLLAAGLIAGCAGAARPVANTSTPARPAPAITVTQTVTAHPHHHKHHAAAAAPPAPAPAPAPAQPVNAGAVVDQFYQDITNHDYAGAWALGGDNIGGLPYGQWVAGYASTASITLSTVSEWNSSTVNAGLVATQTDGSVKTYQGTYTVAGGIITAASIQQTS